MIIAGIPRRGKLLAFNLANECERELASAHKSNIVISLLSTGTSPTELSEKIREATYHGKRYSAIYLVDDVINTGKTMFNNMNKMWNAVNEVKITDRIMALRIVTLVDRDHKLFPVKSDITGLIISTKIDSRIEVVFHNSRCREVYLKRDKSSLL